MSDIYIDLRFHYDSDEEAKRGRAEIVRVFDSYGLHFYDVLRKHNKVDVGVYHSISDNFIVEAQEKINEMFNNFKKDFPTLWTKCVIFNIKIAGTRDKFPDW